MHAGLLFGRSVFLAVRTLTHHNFSLWPRFHALPHPRQSLPRWLVAIALLAASFTLWGVFSARFFLTPIHTAFPASFGVTLLYLLGFRFWPLFFLAQIPLLATQSTAWGSSIILLLTIYIDFLCIARAFNGFYEKDFSDSFSAKSYYQLLTPCLFSFALVVLGVWWVNQPIWALFNEGASSLRFLAILFLLGVLERAISFAVLFGFTQQKNWQLEVKKTLILSAVLFVYAFSLRYFLKCSPAWLYALFLLLPTLITPFVGNLINNSWASLASILGILTAICIHPFDTEQAAQLNNNLVTVLLLTALIQNGFSMILTTFKSLRARDHEINLHTRQHYTQILRELPIGIFTLRQRGHNDYSFDYVNPIFADIVGIPLEQILESPQWVFELWQPRAPHNGQRTVTPQQTTTFETVTRPTNHNISTTDLNPSAGSEAGGTTAQARGLNLQSMTIMAAKQAFEQGQGFCIEERLTIRGQPRWLKIEFSVSHAENGDRLANGVLIDITEEKEQTQRLSVAGQVLKEIHEGLLILDSAFKIVYCNQAVTALTGYSQKEVLQQPLQSFFTNHTQLDPNSKLWEIIQRRESWQGEITFYTKDQSKKHLRIFFSRVKADIDQMRQFIVMLTDITPFKAREEKLVQLAHFDSLTGLATRRLLYDRLNQAISYTARNKQLLAVAYFDLDDFKDVNDEYGHKAGDQVLTDFAQRLQSQLRQSDTAARMGGDEVVVVLPNLKSRKDAAAVFNRIIKTINQPYQVLNRYQVSVTASVGVYYYDTRRISHAQPSPTANDLIQRADEAMYSAKSKRNSSINFVN